MCEANVYILDDKGKKTLVLESVDKIIPKEDCIYLENIFGERKTIKAKIAEMALVDHKILLDQLKDSWFSNRFFCIDHIDLIYK